VLDTVLENDPISEEVSVSVALYSMGYNNGKMVSIDVSGIGAAPKSTRALCY